MAEKRDMIDLLKELANTPKNRKSTPISYCPDPAQLENWITIYKNSLSYLSQKSELTLSHLEHLASIETLDPAIIASLKETGQSPSNLIALTHLDELLTKQLGQEYQRIETELSRQEDFYAGFYQDLATLPSSEKDIQDLRLLQAGVSELTKMRKTLAMPTAILSRLNTKLIQRLNTLSAQQAYSKPASQKPLAPNQYQDNYSLIIDKAALHLTKLSQKTQEKGYLNTEEIESLYAARGAYYNIIISSGHSIPVPQLEQVISQIRTQNLETIELVRESCKELPSQQQREQILIYIRGIAESWQRHT